MGRQAGVAVSDSEPRADSLANYWHFGARRRRLASLLPLLVVALPLWAKAQTVKSFFPDAPRTVASQGVRPIVPGYVGELSRSNYQPVVGVGGNGPRVIVIGFVGGFARRDDPKHPEVQFADCLRDHYGADVYAEVFGNHQGRTALHKVMDLLDSDRDGILSSTEKERARIIIYGHSWGATEAVVFARELGKVGIPVRLTIQVDAISKPGRDNATIPDNVAKAMNLYQSRGPLHGRTQIVAADPSHTAIIGNLHMTYEGHRINCDNYPWYARTFNKPHHEIENDPRVWNLAASLIDSEFTSTTVTAQTSSGPEVR